MSLELRGITKRFGSLTANDAIDLAVGDGEIHAILGENGAGKSTLMNVVYGLLQPDEGSISVDGREIKINSPLDALAAGIGMVHQHFMLIPVFTVVKYCSRPREDQTSRNLGFRERSKRDSARLC
jgi:general nucleoside transport system ATP-binding protein